MTISLIMSDDKVLDEIIDEMNQVWALDWNNLSKILNTRTGEHISLSSFNRIYARKFVTVSYHDGRGGARQREITWSKLWFQHPRRREITLAMWFEQLLPQLITDHNKMVEEFTELKARADGGYFRAAVLATIIKLGDRLHSARVGIEDDRRCRRIQPWRAREQQQIRRLLDRLMGQIDDPKMRTRKPLAPGNFDDPRYLIDVAPAGSSARDWPFLPIGGESIMTR